MKYFIVISFAFAAFSCTGQKTANNSSKQMRNVASYEAMGISAEDADVMQNELDVQSSKGSTTYKEMFHIYSERLVDFKNVAYSTKLTAAQKKDIMLKQTNYAERNIKKQTGGSGVWHSILMKGVQSSRDSINSGDFQGAVGISAKAAALFNN